MSTPLGYAKGERNGTLSFIDAATAGRENLETVVKSSRYAIIAEAANKNLEKFDRMGKWKSIYKSQKNSFIAYENQETKEIVIAYSKDSWLGNKTIEAISFAHKIITELRKKGLSDHEIHEKVSITGHGGGGGLAQTVASVLASDNKKYNTLGNSFRLKTYTFNTRNPKDADKGLLTREFNPAQVDNSHITNIEVKGDGRTIQGGNLGNSIEIAMPSGDDLRNLTNSLIREFVKLIINEDTEIDDAVYLSLVNIDLQSRGMTQKIDRERLVDEIIKAIVHWNIDIEGDGDIVIQATFANGKKDVDLLEIDVDDGEIEFLGYEIELKTFPKTKILKLVAKRLPVLNMIPVADLTGKALGSLYADFAIDNEHGIRTTINDILAFANVYGDRYGHEAMRYAVLNPNEVAEGYQTSSSSKDLTSQEEQNDTSSKKLLNNENIILTSGGCGVDFDEHVRKRQEIWDVVWNGICDDANIVSGVGTLTFMAKITDRKKLKEISGFLGKNIADKVAIAHENTIAGKFEDGIFKSGKIKSILGDCQQLGRERDIVLIACRYPDNSVIAGQFTSDERLQGEVIYTDSKGRELIRGVYDNGKLKEKKKSLPLAERALALLLNGDGDKKGSGSGSYARVRSGGAMPPGCSIKGKKIASSIVKVLFCDLPGEDKFICHHTNIDTCLLEKVYSCNAESVKFLIKLGANVNQRNAQGGSLIMGSLTAQYRWDTPLIKSVLYSIDGILFAVPIGNSKWLHPVIAQVGGCGPTADMIDALIQAGVDVKIKDDKGNTALMLATNPTILKVLLQSGADVNAKNKKGDTAIMIHARKGKIVMVNMLLEFNANINLRNNKGYTVLGIVAESDKRNVERIIKILENAGAEY